jgi:hypothetical protein
MLGPTIKKKISVFISFHHITSFRTCVCLHVCSLLTSAVNRNGKASTKFSKTLDSIRIRSVCLPVTACETQNCCYHSHHDNHSAVSIRLVKMSCGKGIHRVIKKSLCAWWLQNRNLQVLFKGSHASLQTFIDIRLTLTPSVIPNSNYDIMVSDWNCLKYFCVFFYCNYQVH